MVHAPEIVEYMVARVDTVLREELDVPDGLADPRVYCSTPAAHRAYLVECWNASAKTLDEKGADAFRRARSRRRPWNESSDSKSCPLLSSSRTCSWACCSRTCISLAEHERVGVF